MSSEEKAAPASVACTSYFDALYLCYSPFWQVGELYRQGQFDSCSAKWGQLTACLSLKAKPNEEARRALTEKVQQPCLWQIRQPEQATEWWATQFPAKGGGGEAGAEQSGGGGAAAAEE
jgi:hypothetical protein